MPTKKQLFAQWESDFEFRRNPMDSYGDEHLSAEEAAIRRAKTNNAIREQRENPKGEVLGHYIWDKENDCLKFIPK